MPVPQRVTAGQLFKFKVRVTWPGVVVVVVVFTAPVRLDSGDRAAEAKP